MRGKTTTSSAIGVKRTTRLWFLAIVNCLGFLAAACSSDQAAIETTTTQPPPPEIPALALDAYAKLGTPCQGVDWALLAGIGKVESDHGRIFGGTIEPDGTVSPIVLGPPLDGSGVGGNTTPMPVGEWVGQYGIAGEWLQAVGPMQFLPGSFEIHGADGNNDGVQDPHNLYDAAAAAANLLCSQTLAEGADPNDVILAYNQSTEYQEEVLLWANRYRSGRLELAR